MHAPAAAPAVNAPVTAAVTAPAEAPRHRVVALLGAPQAPFELACAAEAFGTQRAALPSYYEFALCTETPGPLPTTLGVPLLVEDGLEALEHADTVVVPGWHPPGSPAPTPVLDALRTAHARGTRIVSICTGAFVLAQAGLLDGRRATTHWARTAQLAAQYPALEVDRDVLYVDHGDVATSAGSGAGIDLCLHLLRRDHGAAYAAQVARHMVLPPHREGSQLQYAAAPAPARADESLAPLLDWAQERLGERLTLDDLAARADCPGAPCPGASPNSSAPAPASGCWPGASTPPGPCWNRPTCRWRPSPPGWAWPPPSTCAAASTPRSAPPPAPTAAPSANASTSARAPAVRCRWHRGKANRPSKPPDPRCRVTRRWTG